MRAARRSPRPWSPRAALRALVAAVVAVNAFAFLLVGYSLRQSWLDHRERAAVSTQNIAVALEQYLEWRLQETEGALDLDEVAKVFRTLDVGTRGVVVLRDADLRLLVRHQREGAPVPRGNQRVSPELQALVSAGAGHGTYEGIAVDGIARTFTFRRLAGGPYVVIVGVASDEHLAAWRQHLAVELALALAFTLLTVAGAAVGWRAWRRREAFEARVQVAERMASLGTLAAGVAHEVNNPLTYVLSNLAFALEGLRDVDAGPAHPARAALREVEQALREAHGGAERVRDIVRDLKVLSRPDDDRMVAVDVNEVIDGVLKMTAGLVASRARLLRRPGAVPPVRASEARLAQVISNLVVNAAQAIPEGRADANRIAVSTTVSDDGRVAIDVEDTGPGIPPEVRSRMFEPFFTTKPVGEGTGLGLSICHGIVRSLGGDIVVDSAVGRGTRFRVLLPSAPAPDAPAARSA